MKRWCRPLLQLVATRQMEKSMTRQQFRCAKAAALSLLVQKCASRLTHRWHFFVSSCRFISGKRRIEHIELPAGSWFCCCGKFEFKSCLCGDFARQILRPDVGSISQKRRSSRVAYRASKSWSCNSNNPSWTPLNHFLNWGFKCPPRFCSMDKALIGLGWGWDQPVGRPFELPRLYTNMKVQLFVAALIAGNFVSAPEFRLSDLVRHKILRVQVQHHWEVDWPCRDRVRQFFLDNCRSVFFWWRAFFFCNVIQTY